MQEAISTGLDKLHLTFSTGHTLETLITTLFDNLSLSQFQVIDNTATGAKKQKKVSWYKTSYYLRTTENTVLIAIHTDPVSHYGLKNLVQIHGLTFSDSALNALRPFNLDKLITGALYLNANVSALDCYIDDRSGSTPLNKIYEQSLPHNYRRFIRSPFVKDHKGKWTVPRLVGDTSLYYGIKGGSACQILMYQKHLSPHQRVYSPENMLKFPWVRFELRLKGAAAKSRGAWLLYQLQEPIFGESPSTGTAVSTLFKKYFNFINPNSARPSRCTPQSWWSELLEKASL